MNFNAFLLVAMIGTAPLMAQQPLTQSPARSTRTQQVNASQQLTESLKSLDDVVKNYMEKDYAVGAELLVIKNRQSVFHKSFGFSDRETKTAWKNGTLCNIRSMTKPITGVAAQILIDRGQLDPKQPVSNYLAGFDNEKSKAITVQQVLQHRSGLPLTNLKKVDEFSDLQSQVAATGEQGPEFPPNSKFWYSDIGTDVVAALVEKLSGQRIDEFVQQEILEPLGMSDTFYGIDASDPRFKRIGSMYIGTANAWLRFWQPQDKPFYPFAWGSQTIYSTPEDYAKFLFMLMDEGKVGNRQIISAEAISRITTPVSRMKMLGSDAAYPTEFRGLEVFYGQMMVVYCRADDPNRKPVIIAHSGSDGTGAWAWPDRDLVVLYFTQSRGGTTVLRIESDIDRLLLHPGEAVAVEVIPAEFEPYVGKYVANFASFVNEEFTVEFKSNKLYLDIPSQMKFELLPPNDKQEWAFAVAPKVVTVTFDRDEANNISGLKLHQAGQSFEVPRIGTPRAKELAVIRKVTKQQIEQLVGTYYDEEAKADVEVYLKDQILCVKAPPGIEFHLRPDRELGHWIVKQSPAITLTFERDDTGKAVSMTRKVGAKTSS